MKLINTSKTILTALVLALTIGNSNAQISETFDSNFDNWSGDVGDFIINNNQELQLNAIEAGESQIWTPVMFPDSLTWSIDVKMAFSPSSNNRLLIYLAAEQAEDDISNGYILQLGESGSDDAIRLLTVNNGIVSEEATGIAGNISSSFNFRISLRKDNNDVWTLTSENLNSSTFNEEFSIELADDILKDLNFFGLHCFYTSSNSDNFTFDNIIISEIIADTTPPEITDILFPNANTIEVIFSEDLNPDEATNANNYILLPTVDFTSLELDSNGNKVIIRLEEELTSCESYTINISNIEDISGNPITTEVRDFSYTELPGLGDILINEILSNPIGNGVDFIEIINPTDKVFDISGLIIRNEARDDEKAIDIPLIIQPNEIIAFSEASLNLILNYNPPPEAHLIEIDLPGFNNSDGNVSLILDENGNRTIIDTYDYEDEQLRSFVTDLDGVSFERLALASSSNNFNNWTAGTQETSFATPGYENAVKDEENDIISITLVNDQEIHIRFKDQVDLESVLNSSNYSLSNNSISDIIIDANNPKLIVLFLSGPLESGDSLNIGVTNIFTNCGIRITDSSKNLILVENAVQGDILINEILFNPLKDQFDYVEIINTSNKFLRINNLQISNSTNGNMTSVNSSYILNPKFILAFTEDPEVVIQQYETPQEANIIFQDLPSFNDDEGNVTISTIEGSTSNILDSFDYSEDLHNNLLRDKEGVSLERISLMSDTNEENNWFSSSSSNNFGTPGYENSARLPTTISEGQIELPYTTFSPNNDGDKDILLINYSFDKPGFVANVEIYNDTGRLITEIANNQILNNSGFLRWDGIDEDGMLSPIGIYIINMNFFHPDGDNIFEKRGIVLAQFLD